LFDPYTRVVGWPRTKGHEVVATGIKPETKMTFQQLTDWYLGLEKVKILAYYPTLKINLNKFNFEFGSTVFCC